jgi:biopolymer transport protein ExbB/biopolymer transport protein TolQ
MLVERLLRIALLGSSWVMYLLLALSAVSIAFIAERVLFFRRHADDVDKLSDKLNALLDSNDQDEAEKLLASSHSVEAQVILGALFWTRGGPAAFEDAVASQFARRKKDLERGMNFLGTIGNNAPFIGLFGTVIGVVEAFHQLGEGANKAVMGNVMSGIAEALVATGVGLFVAIPAVIAYNVLQKKIGAIEENIGAMTKQICALLHTRDRGGTESPRPAAVRPRNGGSTAIESAAYGEAE